MLHYFYTQINNNLTQSELTICSAVVYTFICFSYTGPLRGRPWCWCGPRWTWVWHPCLRGTTVSRRIVGSLPVLTELHHVASPLKARDGYRFFKFSIPVLNRYLNRYFLKKKQKTTIDNDNIKNLFGHIPCKSRFYGALTTNGYQTVALLARSS